MSLVEQARTRLEETRDRIKTRVESVRGGGSSSNPGLPTLKEIREKGVLGVLGGSSSSSSPELLKEIREKGVLSVLEEKFPRVKEIRETRFLGRPASESKREPKEPVGEETQPLRGKTGSDTHTEDHIGVVI